MLQNYNIVGVLSILLPVFFQKKISTATTFSILKTCFFLRTGAYTVYNDIGVQGDIFFLFLVLLGVLYWF